MEPDDEQRKVCGMGDIEDAYMVFEGTLEELNLNS